LESDGFRRIALAIQNWSATSPPKARFPLNSTTSDGTNLPQLLESLAKQP